MKLQSLFVAYNVIVISIDIVVGYKLFCKDKNVSIVSYITCIIN